MVTIPDTFQSSFFGSLVSPCSLESSSSESSLNDALADPRAAALGWFWVGAGEKQAGQQEKRGKK